MRRAMILAALLAVGLAACGGGGGEPAPPPASDQPADSEGQPAEGDAITGTFGGNAKLEGGCAWVDDGTTRWNVQYPDGYSVSLDPPTLTGPEGLKVTAGDTITVTGSEQTDVMTTCQIGPVWQATAVTADGT